MIKWTPKAKQDLEEIAHHIAENFDSELAYQKIDELIGQVKLILTHNPLAGKLLTSNPLFSQLVLEENSIYYCENPRDGHVYIVYIQARGTRLRHERLNPKDIK
ncbi:MAG: type II toxin-antitoxin system RelE/ParE family toxin [Bacteriovoracaceae bacterium]|nr:type II toxin-antitoxin system RelE/ParE family toxin [Bacteriovoracaceae bacterium]